MLISDFYGYQATLAEFNGNFICLMIFKNNFQSFSLLEVYGNDYFFLEVYGNDFFFLTQTSIYVFYREFTRSSLFLFTNCLCLFAVYIEFYEATSMT